MAPLKQAIYGKRGALDLDNLDVTTEEEIDQSLTRARKERGSLDPGALHAMTSSSVLLYTRPDFASSHLGAQG